MKKFKTAALKWTIVAGVSLVLGVMAGSYISGTPVIAAVPQTTVIDNTPAKIESLKQSVVDQIAQCESAGHSEDDGIIIFDTNNKASIGQLQWQKASVIYYEKVLYGKDITAKDAVMIALDTTQAKALAEDVIFKTNNGATDWLNCSNKLNLAPEIKAIKQISQ